jgi:pSer/pThr/pTyr-binding forkhead associated (FHA) protein
VTADVSIPNTAGAIISLRLLDPVQGHPIQTWNFDRGVVIQIGRLEDNAVMLTDPLVSRLHATVRWADGAWELTSQGKHGVLVNDRRIETLLLTHETVFRLGPKGPSLMFVELERASQPDSQIGRATVEIDSRMIETLRIDHDRAQEQVKELTDNEGFEKLLERARAMRERRPAKEE